jgi:hypothetical protein
MPETILSQRTLNRTLLARQMLLGREAMSPLSALEHLVGLQAQLPTSPYIALHARLHAFDPGALSIAMDERRAVRMVLMRGTIHLVTAPDAAAIRPVIQPVLDRELHANRTWARGIDGVDLEPVLALGRALVEERPRTLAELRSELGAQATSGDPASLAYAIRNLLPTLQATPRGLWGRSGDARLTTLEAWTGRSPSTESDPEPLLRRYLRAFGPASVADMQAWSRLQGLRPIVERMRPTLRTYRDERGRELFDLEDGVITDGDLPADVRFLPDYDNALLSHDDRSRIVPPLEWPELGDNVTAPVYLVDGFVAGIWKLDKATRKGEPARLVLRPMVDHTAADEEAIQHEAESLATFLATADPAAPVPVIRRYGEA